MPPKASKKQAKQVVDRSRRRVVAGVVVSDKMDKTIKVRVERFVQHPMFEKTLSKHYVCYAHDEKKEAKRGDKVELAETRPISRLKHWRLLRVVERAAAGIVETDARDAARPQKAAETSSAAGATT